MNFQDLNLKPAVLKAIEAMGYQTPTEIQAQAIPPMLASKDTHIIAQAKTGTGKTLAYVSLLLRILITNSIEPNCSVSSYSRIM